MVSKKLFDEHVDALHTSLRGAVYTKPSRAKRMVYLLRRLAMKLRLRLPRSVKYSFCKHCYVPFAPGENCRVRTRNNMLIYTCFSCKKYTKLVLREKPQTVRK